MCFKIKLRNSSWTLNFINETNSKLIKFNPYVLFEFSAGAIPASLKFTGATPVSWACDINWIINWFAQLFAYNLDNPMEYFN